MRTDGRKEKELRPVTIEKDFLTHPEGSVLISIGNTKVICTASIEDRVPPFMRGSGKGWVTAEYAMIPRATGQRNMRESTKGKVTGRTMEIQRLIGRALRAVVDLEVIGERTIWVDCDVIQADGGTRTAAITGAFVAMTLALHNLAIAKDFPAYPITDFLAATSVGIVKEHGIVVDLNYEEDSNAEVDMNVVMTGSGQFVEVQGTGEESTFSMNELQQLLESAQNGMEKLFAIQSEVLGVAADLINERKAVQ